MISASRVTINSTPTVIATGRCVVFIQESAGVVFLGGSDVTAAQGYQFDPVEHQFSIDKGDTLYGIVASGTGELEVLIFS